jgi:hypothetical protein
MQIVNTGREIELGSKHSDAIAVWMCSSPNDQNSIWRYDIKSTGLQLELAYPLNLENQREILDSAYHENSDNEPWRLSHGTLWEITHGNQGRLKYIYVFPNPDDIQRLDNLEDIDVLIKDCLDVLNSKGIRTVSFILIPVSPLVEQDPDSEDALRIHQIIRSIRNWSSNKESTLTVYMSDRIERLGEFLEQGDLE